MMKMKVVLPIVTVLILALLLGACGRSRPTPAPQPTATQPQPEPTATAAPEEPQAEPTATAVAEEATPAEETAATPMAQEEAAPAEDPVAALNDALQSVLQQLVDPTLESVPNAFGPAPGAVLRLDTPGYQFLEAAGLASVEEGTPVQVDDAFEIGSNTKMFTASLLLQLEEEGVLSLDDPLSKWLPEWAEKIPNGDQMTLRQLANHTSGLWDYADDIIGAGQKDDEIMRRGYTPEELVQYAIDKGTPYFAPGEEGQWYYSNTGYILLGMVLEAATGQKYGDLLQERIFDPLNLTETSFPNDVPEAGTIVDGYDFYPGGKNTTEWNLSQGWAAGGIISTAADMTTFLRALANGQVFHDPQTLLKMADFVTSDAITKGLGAQGYGIGLVQYTDDVWGHSGQTLGYESGVMFAPGTEITLVGLTNAAYGPTQIFMNLAPLLQQMAGAQASAAASTPDFPIPEPDYNAKLSLDFSPFAEAMQTLSDERRAELDEFLSTATIGTIQDAFGKGALTSEELTIYYLDRIKRYDVDNFNSVMILNPDALEDARARDAERAGSQADSPMHGIPVLLKNNIAIQGMPTTAGAVAMKEWIPDRDAAVTEALRKNGAVILGHANLSEWANWMDADMPNGFSALGGQTRNPYGPYDTLGSSSGSAVAAAANFAVVTVGSETQGSLLAPASMNSVVGLKPTHDLVSGDYIIPLMPFQDNAGPMARNVLDTALLLSAMVSPVTDDAAAQVSENYLAYFQNDAWKDLRVGLTSSNDALQQALEQNGLGVTVIDLGEDFPILDADKFLPHIFKYALDDFLPAVNAPVKSLEEVIAFNSEDMQNRAPYGQDHLTTSQETEVSREDSAQQVEAYVKEAAGNLNALFDKYNVDVIIVNDAYAIAPLGQFYAPAGWPAMVIPAGYAEDGQPVPFGFVARPYQEAKMLGTAFVVEQLLDVRIAPDLEATIQMLDEKLGDKK